MERVFDLARSIDLHVSGFQAGHHFAIGGITKGLIGAGEEVEWKGKAFGIWWKHHSQIVAYNRPFHFRDSMKQGAFRHYDHDHFFESVENGTIMRDIVHFEAPAGLLGRWLDSLLLQKYMSDLIARRSESIRSAAESDLWKRYL
jgi:ligand-binding SRPBCC domain-containing protein